MKILSDLCIGRDMARLLRLEKRLSRLGIPVHPLLLMLLARYNDRMAGKTVRDGDILESLDTVLVEAVAISADHVQKIAVAALTGIRCDLFPQVPFSVRRSGRGANEEETVLSVANSP